MALFSKALEKLTIVAYASDVVPHKELGSVTATFNPESINFSYQAEYESMVPVDQSKAFPSFRHLKNGNLNVTLLFDTMQDSKHSVSQEVTNLNALCTSINGSTGETSFLEIKWGKLSWSEMDSLFWRMTDMTTTYKLFRRDGSPLRAEVALVLTPCPRPVKSGISGKNAPGYTIIPQAKSYLPVLAATSVIAMAAAESSYLALAQMNPQLDSLNGMKPKQLLKASTGVDL
ncbi:hypothetical protein [Rouxiella sp. WC2420]|uniref:Contractile injection system tube protein N-terminal domain-containing protein n=1 Tax=Rouxiella sp. WC2420 TaxID=3234145 RepID=A0AB39VVU8_9GAMM